MDAKEKNPVSAAGLQSPARRKWLGAGAALGGSFLVGLHLPTRAEEEQLARTPLRDIAHRLAALTGMKFFSSEVALSEAGEFVLIDYVNDQCHMLSQSANPQMGVPDELVSAIARRLVEGIRQIVKP